MSAKETVAQNQVDGETDGDFLAQQAYDELAGKEPEARKKPEETESEPQKEPLDESVPSDSDKESDPDSNKGPEDKAEETTPKDGDDKEDGQKPETDEIVTKFASKHKISYEEAKEELEQVKAVLKKYGDDPVEVARALRSQQSEYDKIKADKEDKSGNNDIIIKSREEVEEEVRNYAEKNKDKIIENFRARYPNRTELMTDEAILEWASEEAMKGYDTWSSTQKEKIRVAAVNKREELLKTLTANDAKFVNDVKQILSNISDTKVTHKDFSLNDVLYYVKGKKYDADLKAEFERGLKLGKESPKILGSSSNTSSAKVVNKSNTITLNEAQKERALEMFPDSEPEQAYKSYSEVYSKELAKNKNFVY